MDTEVIVTNRLMRTGFKRRGSLERHTEEIVALWGGIQSQSGHGLHENRRHCLLVLSALVKRLVRVAVNT